MPDQCPKCHSQYPQFRGVTKKLSSPPLTHRCDHAFHNPGECAKCGGIDTHHLWKRVGPTPHKEHGDWHERNDNCPAYGCHRCDNPLDDERIINSPDGSIDLVAMLDKAEAKARVFLDDCNGYIREIHRLKEICGNATLAFKAEKKLRLVKEGMLESAEKECDALKLAIREYLTDIDWKASSVNELRELVK